MAGRARDVAAGARTFGLSITAPRRSTLTRPRILTAMVDTLVRSYNRRTLADLPWHTWQSDLDGKRWHSLCHPELSFSGWHRSVGGERGAIPGRHSSPRLERSRLSTR